MVYPIIAQLLPTKSSMDIRWPGPEQPSLQLAVALEGMSETDQQIWWTLHETSPI